MIDKGDSHDPKGLIFESYRITGILPEECRAIFLDWALSLPVDTDTRPEIEALLTRYEPLHPSHPMTETLRAGLEAAAKPRRRGGARGRDRGGK
ncbi:hypothetical protein E4Z66_04975 [Aliishimia ponticola]|uniref:Uncharacterized protein n=1 Tax=Aliishimia ponticola TaxID=2499833 RepID=A0A4V3XKZ8_9RHOB|nr:hypothetical protein [Aliishimia ponticola]THH38913.1 hypothetical protein E4Z66_04975 [Aliishimia ponticola]